MSMAQLILEIILVIIGFYLAFIKNYYNEKGKNQATKEDIGEITDIVENIKSDLLKQNELLKAQLSFKNQHRLNVKSAEREALFDFNKSISAWIYSVMRFTFAPYDIDNYESLKSKSEDFAKRQYECDLAEAHLGLFMNNTEFLKLKGELNSSIIKLQGVVEKSMHEIYHVYSKCKFELEIAKNDIGKQFELRGNLFRDLSPIFDAHRKNSLEEYRKVNSLHSVFTKVIFEKLKLLEE